MKFLITSITGFAGPHLANLLHKEGHEVYGLIRRTNGMESDIRDVIPDEVYESITFFYADLVITGLLEKCLKRMNLTVCFISPHNLILQLVSLTLSGRWKQTLSVVQLIQVIQDHQPDCKLMFCSTSEV